MERGSDKHGPRLDEEMKDEAAPLESGGKESHTDEEREKEWERGHRVSGTGSSADVYPHQDHGETGGEGHPQDPDDRERPQETG